MAKIIVGITGASGIVLGYRVIEVLASMGHKVFVVMSKDASVTAKHELGLEYSSFDKMINTNWKLYKDNISLYKNHDFTAPIASGSYLCDGMVIIPCSMSTLACVANGISNNLIRRAADVMLKEKRKLVIVPREAPFSTIHLQNMLTLSQAGAVIVPPVPAWYNNPKNLSDVENTIVGRVLDCLNIHTNIYRRWS